MASLSLSAQDFHNTYWQFAPTVVSPAFTGAFYGNIRVSGIGRNQGRPLVNQSELDAMGNEISGNVTGNEFNDLNLLIDGNIPFGFREGDWVSAGINLFNSKVGQTGLKRSFSGLSLAYHLSLNKKQTRVFTVGLKYGTYGKSFAPGQNLYDPFGLANEGAVSQDITAFNEENPIEEQPGGSTGLSVSDWTIGLMYTTPVGKNADLRIGVASDHLFSPRLEAKTDSTIVTGVNRNENLSRRLNAYMQYYVSLNDDVVWNPTILYQTTFAGNQLLIQSLFSILVNKEKQFTFNAGLGVRFTDSMDIPIYLGANWKDWRFGLSYDTNVTGLTQANSTFGALEIAASKLINWNKKPKVDPIFVCPRL